MHASAIVMATRSCCTSDVSSEGGTGGGRTRSFGQPRRSGSLNAAASGTDAGGGGCTKPDPSGSRLTAVPPQCNAQASLGCGLGTLATASLALGMMSPPATGQPTSQGSGSGGAEAVHGERRSGGGAQQRGGGRGVKPSISLRRLPANEVTKHPGVKNALKVRVCPTPRAAALPAAPCPSLPLLVWPSPRLLRLKMCVPPDARR